MLLLKTHQIAHEESDSGHTWRWLDTVFQGHYLPHLSINYVAINKDLEKIATIVVLDKDENLL